MSILTFLINSLKGIFFVHTNFSQFVVFPKQLDLKQQEIIYKHSRFYRCLSAKEKKVFEHRVYRFIEEHNFVGNKIEITSKIKILVATMAVTLTFGMRSYLFSRVKTIIIYPKSYYSTILKQYHKGETNPKLHLVVFSWIDFLDGIRNENDNLNLALHEFSHALHFGFLNEKSYSALNFKIYFNQILEYLKNEKNRERLLKANYFRSYGYENKYEFIAVLIEHYFETPNEFKSKLPKLFLLVNKALNIDILKIYNR
ncbi:zinc-dependent peptidase [Lutibacter sp. TH_r2]|uniref:zinc-dependent peptidase n=1 Tax=Lutibacter sp. TH_r2 TaxID=3082083 RepID=UPI0029545761|nr:zinc-dependent peptidase [Lutibacter sp. TH_r2]MDV7187025.1 zinc-dependent peptidase [Lutibacter sp. TH_r2]